MNPDLFSLLDPPLWVWLIAGVVIAVFHAVVVLPRQPEPSPDTPGAGEKTPYAQIASKGFVLICAGIAGACQLVAPIVPAPLRLGWLVWGSAIVVLIAVDALSTWMPRRLTWICLGGLAVGLVIGIGLGDAWWRLIPAVISALVVGGFFWLVWRIGAGLGFGDVRLALGLGAISGAYSASFAMTALVSGTIIGAVWAIAHRMIRGPGRVFAYGPALWSGPYLALLIERWM